MLLLIVNLLNARSSEKLNLHALGCLRKVFGELKTKDCISNFKHSFEVYICYMSWKG